MTCQFCKAHIVNAFIRIAERTGWGEEWVRFYHESCWAKFSIAVARIRGLI